MGLLRSDDAVALRAELARDLGWRRWGCGGARRGAARMLEGGERPLLAALASRPRVSASGKPRMPLTSWLLVATDRRLIIALKWPLGRLHAEQVRYEDVVAMHAEPDRGEVMLSTPSATLRLCFFLPFEAESELIALLAERLPRERVGTGVAELPSEAWELTAPESYLLRYAEHGPRAIDAFKLAVQELVARRALRVEAAAVARRWLPGTKAVWLITAGPQIGAITSPALTPVLQLFRHAQGRHSRIAVSASAPDREIAGVVLPDFVVAAARRSHGFSDYLRDVEGSLTRRGLFAGRGRFRNEPRHTVAGRQAKEDLDSWLDEGKRYLTPRARAENPARALDYLRRAGAAVLLIPNAGAALRYLDAVLRADTVDNQALYGVIINPPADHAADGGSDLWASDGALTALEGLDSAFDAIDTSIEVAGGDGGDGGGGGGS